MEIRVSGHQVETGDALRHQFEKRIYRRQGGTIGRAEPARG
ncbi:MAG TPA: hypothetical protein VGB08_06560 [Allosphingosinicella sp.]|jgi:ribosome-associated translation inhibitor RaiA